jgi:hypothetical protein
VVTAAAIPGGLAAHRVSLDPLPFVGTQAFAIGLLIGIGGRRRSSIKHPVLRPS